MTTGVYSPPKTFRASDETDRQLNDLMSRWGENRSKAIIRCIERVWWQEVASKRDSENVTNDGGVQNE